MYPYSISSKRATTPTSRPSSLAEQARKTALINCGLPSLCLDIFNQSLINTDVIKCATASGVELKNPQSLGGFDSLLGHFSLPTPGKRIKTGNGKANGHNT